MTDPQSGTDRPETPDDSMTKEEKEELVDQIEEFEGPDRREVRGEQEKHSNEPGISRS